MPLPSGENLTEMTTLVCPQNACHYVSLHPIDRDLSPDPETMRLAKT